MKRKGFYLLMMTVCLAALLTGCGEDKKNTESAPETTEVSETKKETENSAEDGDDFVQGIPAEETEEGEVSEISDEVDITDSVTIEISDGEYLTGMHHVEMDLENYGTISMELNADSAPITVTNFIKLVQDDFYDGLTFHRIIDGFMMQGGDPMGNGTGGSKENIKGEFSSNGVENRLSHARGAVSMARASAPDSASSQFFIVQTDSHFLDGEYAVFGYVTEGMDIVDEICAAAEPVDNNGLIAANKQPVITDIRLID